MISILLRFVILFFVGIFAGAICVTVLSNMIEKVDSLIHQSHLKKNKNKGDDENTN